MMPIKSSGRRPAQYSSSAGVFFKGRKHEWHLGEVKAPTLLVAGAADDIVIELNRQALACEKQLTIDPGATHLFEKPGTLDAVVEAAGDCFETLLGGAWE